MLAALVERELWWIFIVLRRLMMQIFTVPVVIGEAGETMQY
jgi:hypothetical protein